MTAESFALVFASALAGMGLYVNGVEQPARMALDDAAMLQEWGPSDRRGVALMAMLSLAAAIAGLLAFYQTGSTIDLIGALAAACAWPYTIFVMTPVDNQIIALAGSDIGAARALLWQWGLLQYGQTAIAIFAVLVFLWAR